MNPRFPEAPLRSRTLRVALADDHAVVRAGYRRLLELEPDIAVVAEFGDADAAYSALTVASASSAPAADLLVLDLSMPGRSGLDLLSRLAARLPELPVLVFTMHDSAAMLDQCLRAGAAGFVTKSSAPEVLVDAVRRAARGEIALSPDMVALASAAARAPGQPPHTRLSSREFDILQQLIAGRSVEEIAQTLRLSAKTVANYQTGIRHTLGVGSAVELLRYAKEQGLIDGY
ncbi:MAG TPA: response regulator transcription factor [Methylibium sp.]|uniref:response regulator transcription factor n=1 Tax=Methylibium sp. TaxID=2067992 RepID=UPI002DB707F0|nr:response regulator transcription factor [Methylibium sp.]HEU4459815.1 response regulator transcription factor [Methylibium sp.]